MGEELRSQPLQTLLISSTGRTIGELLAELLCHQSLQPNRLSLINPLWLNSNG
jgi:hypothetical protein